MMSAEHLVSILIDSFVERHGLPPVGALNDLVYDHFFMSAPEDQFATSSSDIDGWVQRETGRINGSGVKQQLGTLFKAGFTPRHILFELGLEQDLP